MFESLALENPKNTRRRWTTAASFVLEALGVGILILAPLGYTEAISLRIDKPLVVPPGRATPIETHQRPETSSPAPPPSQMQGSHIVYGGKIPPRTNLSPDPTPVGNPIGEATVATSTGSPTGDPTFNNLFGSGRQPVIGPPPITTTHQRVPISHLDPGLLIKQVQPVYPKIAIISHTEGTVLLAAVIDTQGRITQLHALSGHPFLVPAAISAVQQWRYKPYILNGQAVEVETQVSVVFSLQH